MSNSIKQVIVTVVACAITGLVSWVLVTTSDNATDRQLLQTIATDVSETRVELKGLGESIEDLGDRVTRLEEQRDARNARVDLFWSKDWPQVIASIDMNRKAIDALSADVRALEKEVAAMRAELGAKR